MEEKRTKIVLHPDTDAGVAQWLLRKILLDDKPVEYVFVPPGHRYQGDDAEPGYIFHIDTGGIYAPEKGYFDHHGLSPNHPKYGKCSALLVLEYFEEVFKCNFPAELKTLAWFAQSVDKEKEKDEKFNLYAQDPISASILVKLPEEISLSSRAKVPMNDIMGMINCKIESYLQKRGESKMFSKWYYENLDGKVRIKKTKWEIPALIVYECPYDSGDFRNLVRYYIRLHSFIIAHYLPTPGRNYHRYGVNKPDGMPQPDLHRIERLLCDRYPYPQLQNDNTKLFVHNSGLFLYLNEIPEDLSFEGFIKIVLEEG
jgi:hypothetical protein